ncbi:acyltransferase [Nocardioides ginkgobilobae]
MIELGDRVVISRDVKLLTHDYSLTTALRAIGKAPPVDVGRSEEIRVGDNVFLGLGVVVLPGTRIPRDVIIGAGSVVRGELQPDSIYVGNPAMRISSISGRANDWVTRRDDFETYWDRS